MYRIGWLAQISLSLIVFIQIPNIAQARFAKGDIVFFQDVIHKSGSGPVVVAEEFAVLEAYYLPGKDAISYALKSINGGVRLERYTSCQGDSHCPDGALFKKMPVDSCGFAKNGFDLYCKGQTVFVRGDAFPKTGLPLPGHFYAADGGFVETKIEAVYEGDIGKKLGKSYLFTYKIDGQMYANSKAWSQYHFIPVAEKCLNGLCINQSVFLHYIEGISIWDSNAKTAHIGLLALEPMFDSEYNKFTQGFFPSESRHNLRVDYGPGSFAYLPANENCLPHNVACIGDMVYGQPLSGANFRAGRLGRIFVRVGRPGDPNIGPISDNSDHLVELIDPISGEQAVFYPVVDPIHR